MKCVIWNISPKTLSVFKGKDDVPKAITLSDLNLSIIIITLIKSLEYAEEESKVRF